MPHFTGRFRHEQARCGNHDPYCIEQICDYVVMIRAGRLVYQSSVARASTLLGVVAFGIAVAQVASEYSLGTLRQILVRQPRRAVLLTGKIPGIITFLVLALSAELGR